MVERTNRTTGKLFWGCPDWPQCADRPPDTPDLHQTIRTLTRQRDTLQAGYDRLLTEVQQLRRLKAPHAVPAERLVHELTRLIGLVHPDKWRGESPVAAALTRELLAVRARLQEGRW